MEDEQVERLWGELRDGLDDAIGILESVGERGWSVRLQRGRAKVDAFGGNGLDSVLAMFGGMGSFSDLVVHPANGHDVSESDVPVTNERLGDLRTQIYAAATALRAAFPG